MKKLLFFIAFLFLASYGYCATYVNDGNINWNGNWQTTSKVDTLHSSTNLLVDSGSTQYSEYWSGNASNTDIGCLAYLDSHQNAGTITITLQSATDTGFTTPTNEATSTFTINSTTKAGTWLFFKLSLSITENGSLYYRYKFTSDNSADTYFRANNANTTKIAIVQVLSATGTLAAGDVTYIVGNANGATGNPAEKIVTVNINSTTGYGVISIGNGGTLSWSTTANTKLTTTGDIYGYNGGKMLIGSTTTSIPSSYTAELARNTTQNSYLYCYSGFTFQAQGASKTYFYTTLANNASSGQANITTTDTTGWSIGDELVICTTSSTRTETELKTIQSISGTSITLNSNLSYSHSSGGYVVNITRNVIISSNGSYGADIITYTPLDFDWASVKGIKYAYRAGMIHNAYNCGIYLGTFDYSVFRDSPNACGILGENSGGTFDINYCVFYNNGNTGFSSAYGSWDESINKVIQYNFFINNNGAGAAFVSSEPGPFGIITFTNNIAIGNNWNGFSFNHPFAKTIIKNCIAHTNSPTDYSTGGFRIGSGLYEMNNNKSFYNCAGLFLPECYFPMIKDSNSYYGNDGTSTKANSKDIAFDNDYNVNGGWYIGNNIKLDSSTEVYFGYNSQRYNRWQTVRISNYDMVTGRHKQWLKYGTISDQITGGQAESWAYGGSGICVYLNPTSTTPGNTLNWEFKIPVTAATDPQLKFYVKKTSSTANCTLNMDIYDSNNDSTKLVDNASITLTDSWTQYSASSFTPSTTGYCRVVLKALDGSTTGDIGIDDISIVISGTTATDHLNNWTDGLPLLQFDRGGGGGGGAVTTSYGFAQ